MTTNMGFVAPDANEKHPSAPILDTEKRPARSRSSPPGRHTSRTRIAPLPAVTAVWSVLCAGLGLWWLLDFDAYPLATGQSDGVLMIVPPTAAAVAFLALGLAGVPLAMLLGRTGDRTRGRGVILLAGAGYVIVVGVVAPDVQLLAFLGYLTALSAPLVVVGLLIGGARRHPGNLIPLALIGTAIVVGFAMGQIGEPTLRMFESIGEGLRRVGFRPVILVVMVAGGALFALLTLAAAGRGRGWPRTPEGRVRLDRWGRVATWVAAACPMPYVLIRMTWLTPWPQGIPGGPESLGAGVRVFGILLGLAALGGAVLTLGLIYRWGEVFPAWLPRLRGRRVPVMAAVVPATVVSVALCASAVSLAMMSTNEGAGWVIAAIPTPIWGPALGLATYAYYRRRTQVGAGTAAV